MLVNNELIDESLIKEEARTIRPHLYQAMAGQSAQAVEAKVQEWSRENVIERVLLRQAAQAEGLTEETLLARITAHLSPPRNKEITEYYRKNRESLVMPERVHAAHIIKNVNENTSEEAARIAIEEAERKLREGAKFEEVADQFSDCPGNGGDLATFPRGEMVPEFDAVVFNLKPGEISGIFRTQFGFHIAKVIEKWPEGIPELNEIRAQIEATLFQEKKQRTIEQYLDRLRAKADVRE